jgi:hypothetical protein
MGLYERDYVRAPQRRAAFPFAAQSITIWLIGINVAVFLLNSIVVVWTTGPEGERFGYLSRADLAISHLSIPPRKPQPPAFQHAVPVLLRPAG